jgi:hypothetical protein
MPGITRAEEQLIDEYQREIHDSLRQTTGPGINKLSQITSHLFVSNWKTGSDSNLVAGEKIKHALCLSSKDASRVTREFKKRKIELQTTDPGHNLVPFFNHSYHYIKNLIEHGESVLVFCDDGMSLSPAVVCAYLLFRHYAGNFAAAPAKLVDSSRMFLPRIVAFVKQTRGCILISDSFVRQLLLVEISLKKYFSAEYDAVLSSEKRKTATRKRYHKLLEKKQPKRSEKPAHAEIFDSLESIPEKSPEPAEKSQSQSELAELSSADSNFVEDLDLDLSEN